MKNMDLPRPKLLKVPGNVTPIKQSENVIKDLTKLTQLELLDLKARQEQLLAKKHHLSHLPDKGARIQQLLGRIIAEIYRRAAVDAATQLLSNLQLTKNKSRDVSALEWNHGKSVDLTHVEDILDSDDETDELRIIAQRPMHEKRLIVLPPPVENTENFSESTEPSDEKVVDADLLIMDVNKKFADLSFLKSKHKKEEEKTNEIDKHGQNLINKTVEAESHPAEKFKPYRSTVNNVHDPEKERLRKKGKYWEVTAATPPHIRNKPSQMITLLDSVEIQNEYLTKLKELQEKRAEERLQARLKRLDERAKLECPTAEEIKTNKNFTTYRHVNSIEGTVPSKEELEKHEHLEEETTESIVNYTFKE